MIKISNCKCNWRYRKPILWRKWMPACEREQASECVSVCTCVMRGRKWMVGILRDRTSARVTACEYEWILKHYPRMNVAWIKAWIRVTIRCIFSFVLAATQWYLFVRVVIFPFACFPFRVVRGAAAFELEERERKSNVQVYKKNYNLTDNSLFTSDKAQTRTGRWEQLSVTRCS